MDQKVNLVFQLMIIYHFKHLFADFLLQSKYMLNKNKADLSFVKPLALHCLVHATGTLIICLIYDPCFWWLCFFDFAVHFTIDRIKSGPKYLGRFNDLSKNSFWNILGLDQMAHHLTHIFIIYMLVS